jgi:hypothetical protein
MDNINTYLKEMYYLDIERAQVSKDGSVMESFYDSCVNMDNVSAASHSFSFAAQVQPAAIQVATGRFRLLINVPATPAMRVNRGASSGSPLFRRTCGSIA